MFKGLLKKIILKLDIKTIVIAVSMGLVFLLLLINTYFTYKSTTGIVLKKTEKIEESNLKQMDNKISIAVSEIRKLSFKIEKSARLHAYLKSYADAADYSYQRTQERAKVMSQLSSVLDVYGRIYSIDIYTPSGEFCIKENDAGLSYNILQASSLYKDMKMAPDGIYIMEPDYILGSDSKPAGRFAFCMALAYDGAEAGIMIISMKSDWLENLLGENIDAVITRGDTHQSLWASSPNAVSCFNDLNSSLVKPDSMGDMNLNGARYIVYSRDTSVKNWRLIIFSSFMTISSEMKMIGGFSLLSYIAAMIFCAVAAIFFSKRIIQPIRELLEEVRKYRAGAGVGLHGNSRRKAAFLKLRSEFIVFFIILFIGSTLINVIILYFSLTDVVKRKIADSIQTGLVQTTRNIDYFIDINERKSKSIVIDKVLREALVNSDKGVKKQDDQSVNDVIYENMVLGDGVFETAIYNAKRENIFSTSVFTDKKLRDASIDRLLYSRGAPVWTVGQKDSFERQVLVLMREIRDDGSVGGGEYMFKVIGYLSATYYEVDIERLYNGLSEGDGSVYLTDLNGVILSHTVKQNIGLHSPYQIKAEENKVTVQTVTQNGVKSIIFMMRCSRLPLVLVREVPYSLIMEDNWQILNFNIYFFIISLMVITVLSWMISQWITRPIDRISRSLSSFGKGDMNADFGYISGPYEIEELSIAFNDMAVQIKKLIHEVYEAGFKQNKLESEKKQAELEALKAQINPHFLYNTLESIKWLVKSGDKSKAADMISDLGEFFRMGIKKGEEFIPLHQEIEFEKSYLSLYEHRLGDKLRVFWDIGDELEGYLLPQILLQPLLENAIHHGIQEKEDGGSISITGCKVNDHLILAVSDDGPGISREKLETIRRNLAGKLSGNSIGINNVQKRIHLYYGMEYGLEIYSIPGGGTTVSMRLPATRQQLPPVSEKRV